MQDKNSKEVLFEALRKLAMIKGAEVTEERHKAYCEHLEKYDLGRVLDALKVLFETMPKFPDISDILKIVDPPLSENDKGNEMAGAIISAISQYGQYQVLEAKEALGPVAWWVVDRVGGWGTICLVKNSELGTLRSQIREMAKAADKISNRSSDKKLLHHQKTGAKKLDEYMIEFNNQKKLT